jgi:Transposase IS66 family
VPVLAKGKTRTGRLWTYVRDDRPFAGPDPPAAMFFYSRDRGGEHPEQHLASYAGLMQADAYAGFSKLYEKTPGSYPYRYGASVLSAIALAGGVAVLEQMQGTSISDFLFADDACVSSKALAAHSSSDVPASRPNAMVRELSRRS